MNLSMHYIENILKYSTELYTSINNTNINTGTGANARENEKEFLLNKNIPVPDSTSQSANTDTGAEANTMEIKKSNTCNKRRPNPLLKFYDDDQLLVKKSKRNPNKQNSKPRIHPKKSYFRIKLIRSFKKFLRTGKFNEKFEGRGKNQKAAIKKSIEELKKYCKGESESRTEVKNIEENKDEFTITALTKSELETEAKNNKKVKEFFLKSKRRKAFKMYVDTIFLEKGPNKLAQLFGFNCCENKSLKHNHECDKKWEELQHFSYSELIGFNPLPEDSNLDII
ncbi:hypothetical protein SteCoe_6685 [Stentor coeruleus]|uniref:Uncharacterized protein n=1 Tax=Stentor coeruleus TaxID=5963 RepID=A0A1R2CPI2_9CILI|nr:hypothetical protein SteCoe_6685 [Stentor coeruleus]